MPITLRIKITRARVVIVTLLAMVVAACGAAVAENPQTTEVRIQDQISASYLKTQPPPVHSFSQMRQNLIELENAQATGVQTTSFFCSNLCDKANPPLKFCPSIGAPIATTDQLTSPDQPLREASQPLNDTGGNLTVGQMDPNGVYSGNSTGTYVMCVGSDGRVRPAYWEGYVETEFAPAVWNYSTGQVQDVGAPSFKFSK